MRAERKVSKKSFDTAEVLKSRIQIEQIGRPGLVLPLMVQKTTPLREGRSSFGGMDAMEAWSTH